MSATPTTARRPSVCLDLAPFENEVEPAVEDDLDMFESEVDAAPDKTRQPFRLGDIGLGIPKKSRPTLPKGLQSQDYSMRSGGATYAAHSLAVSSPRALC